MSNFWLDNFDDLSGAFTKESSIDTLLQGKELDGPAFSSMRALTDNMRLAAGLELPVEAGTRVRFVSNIGSVLTYPDVPDVKIAGTVVTVRTGSGDTTCLDDRVFVAWDDGVFRPIYAEHLRQMRSGRVAKNVRMHVSSMMDLTSFFSSARGNDLVHKSTKDLWSVTKKSDGFVINRLFKDNGEPLKV